IRFKARGRRKRRGAEHLTRRSAQLNVNELERRRCRRYIVHRRVGALLAAQSLRIRVLGAAIDRRSRREMEGRRSHCTAARQSCMLLCGKRLGVCSERRRQSAFRRSLQTSDRWPRSARLLPLRAVTIYKRHNMKIAIGSDHAGFKYKEAIKLYLTNLGHEVADYGTDSEAPVDYPIFIRPVAEAVARGEF